MSATLPRQSEVIVLRIPGHAAGKGRPRFDPRSKRTYTPTETVTAENLIRLMWADAGGRRLPDESAIALAVTITAVRPASHFRKDGQLTAEGLRHPVPRRKPDLDNAVKLICDALNGRAYRDDVQIAYVQAERCWGHRPETLVTLRPMPWRADTQQEEE